MHKTTITLIQSLLRIYGGVICNFQNSNENTTKLLIEVISEK